MAKYVLLDDEAPAPKKGGYVLLDDAPEKPLVEKVGGVIKTAVIEAPRQAGLTARHALEGLGETLDFVGTPIRAVQNAAVDYFSPKGISSLVTGKNEADKYKARTGVLTGVADYLGLPKPENSTERVVGDVSKLLAGGGGLIGGANKVNQVAKVGGVTQNVAKALAAKPMQQAISAAGAGFGGGSVREAGGDDTAQFFGSIIGGLGAPLTEDFAVKASKFASKKIGDALSQFKPAQAGQIADSISIKINQVLQDSGVKLNDFSPAVQKELRGAVEKAVNFGGGLDVDALRRLADYRLIGATPTRASLTLNPVEVTQQKNLAKLGVNTNNEALQRLGLIENQNNQRLIEGLNDLGAARAKDLYGGGEVIGDTLNRRIGRAEKLIGDRYDLARDTQGRSAQLDPSYLTNMAHDNLEYQLKQGSLSPKMRGYLNGIAKGEIPLTVDTAEILKTSLARTQRTSLNGDEKWAAGIVRDALESTPLSTNQQLGQESIDAFRRARQLNRSWEKNIVGKTPALQAVRDGIEPDKFVQQFITGDSKNSSLAAQRALKSSIKGNPDAVQEVRNQIAAALKKSGTNQAVGDDVGKLSNSAYNRMLDKIGDRKLSVWFTPQEIAQFKATGRVAAYEQFQPTGSSVNNSGTSGASGFLSQAMKKTLAATRLAGEGVVGVKEVLLAYDKAAAGQQAQKAFKLADALALQKQRQASPMNAAFLPLLLSNQNRD